MPSHEDYGLDPRCGLDANLQHLKHWIEGYRSYILGEDDCPYSVESARWVSWKQGRKQAIEEKEGT